MTSETICDILVMEKKQQSLQCTENCLITSEYGLSNAAGFEGTCCVCYFGEDRRRTVCFEMYLHDRSKSGKSDALFP